MSSSPGLQRGPGLDFWFQEAPGSKGNRLARYLATVTAALGVAGRPGRTTVRSIVADRELLVGRDVARGSGHFEKVDAIDRTNMGAERAARAAIEVDLGQAALLDGSAHGMR
jgi:hypothetical protein